MAAWTSVDEETGHPRVFASTRTPGADWSSAAAISPFSSDLDAGTPAVAAGVGDAIAVWSQRGARGGGIATAGFWF